MQKLCIALVVGNRGFFPGHLCEAGRADMLDVLAKAGFDVVTLSTADTRFGSVESLDDAQKAADQLKAHAGKIDGVIVTLPNFGDEKAIANTLRWSNLRVPVLVHAFNDDPAKMTIKDRRDSFCGKMSVCNNLRQYDIPFSLTRLHTDDPRSATFAADLSDFAATCRVVRAMRGLRIGALGARPTAFNTVRYSEKLLEQSGISVETMDLFDFFGRVNKLGDSDPRVGAKLKSIQGYVNTGNVPQLPVIKMAKLGVVLDEWKQQAHLDATAIQCWTAMEEFYGVVPCTLMSMQSNDLSPSACEVDVVGTVAMVALAKASQKPAALVDWNNNYGTDPDKGVVFHCSNLPKDIFVNNAPAMDYQEIIAGTVGKDNTYGTVVGRVAAAPCTYLRVGTDDQQGRVRAYLGEGQLTSDPLNTFGGVGVIQVPRFQELLRYICQNGFEHHVAITPSLCAGSIREALSTYLGWDVHHHR